MVKAESILEVNYCKRSNTFQSVFLVFCVLFTLRI